MCTTLWMILIRWWGLVHLKKIKGVWCRKYFDKANSKKLKIDRWMKMEKHRRWPQVFHICLRRRRWGRRSQPWPARPSFWRSPLFCRWCGDWADPWKLWWSNSGSSSPRLGSRIGRSYLPHHKQRRECSAPTFVCLHPFFSSSPSLSEKLWTRGDPSPDPQYASLHRRSNARGKPIDPGGYSAGTLLLHPPLISSLSTTICPPFLFSLQLYLFFVTWPWLVKVATLYLSINIYISYFSGCVAVGLYLYINMK